MGFALFSTDAMVMAARDALQVHGGFKTPFSFWFEHVKALICLMCLECFC
jgi:hypothetical protein